MPMPGAAAPKSLPDYLAAVMDRLILTPPNGEGLAYDGTTPRLAERPFALTMGKQWLDQWTGANACCLVPSTGSPSTLRTLQTKRERVALFSVRWATDIYIWGRDPDSSVVGRVRDVERLREPIQVFENVARVMWLLASGYGQIDELSGFMVETQNLDYGAAIKATFSVPVPVYDYKKTYIPVPQTLTPAAGHPVVEGGSSA
jgi:hypothetical protein